MKVLVAGGAGYIGSHICVELLQANHEVIVIDDFSNSKPEVLGYIKDITGKDVKFYEFNILEFLLSFTKILFICEVPSIFKLFKSSFKFAFASTISW